VHVPVAHEAFLIGLLSAASLPLGSVTAKFWTPGNRVVAAMMAFGGGALLSALTIDIVGNALRQGKFYPLALGCILGGLLFVFLNKAVNDKGGFLRKSATTINYLNRKKRRELKQIFKEMSQVSLLNHLPQRKFMRWFPMFPGAFTNRAVRLSHKVIPVIVCLL